MITLPPPSSWLCGCWGKMKRIMGCGNEYNLPPLSRQSSIERIHRNASSCKNLFTLRNKINNNYGSIDPDKSLIATKEEKISIIHGGNPSNTVPGQGLGSHSSGHTGIRGGSDFPNRFNNCVGLEDSGLDLSIFGLTGFLISLILYDVLNGIVLSLLFQFTPIGFTAVGYYRRSML